MSGQAFGVALNPQNVVPIDINISTSIYTTIVPPYQNISSGTYQVMINTLSDTYFQTRDRGVVFTSNFSYSTVALSLFGSGNSQFMYQNMRDNNYFPLVTRTSPFTTSMNAVAWNGSVFVAVGQGSTNIATSTDGLAWVPRDTPNIGGSIFGSSGAFAVTWNFTMSNWLVAGSNANNVMSNVVAISRDNGVTWTGASPGFTTPLASATSMGRPGYSANPPFFIAGRSNATDFVSSSNPIGTYTYRGGGSVSFLQVVWNGTVWVGAGNTNQTQYSFDGLTWFASPVISGHTNRAVAWSPTLGLWVLVGTSGSGAALIYYSPTGANWIVSATGPTSATGNGLQDVIWTGTQIVAVGAASGAFGCYSSTNGINYTLQAATIFTTQANGVAWSPTLGLYVAVGQDTTNNIATSTNLTAWTGRTGLTIFSTRGNFVAWSPQLAMFVAVGAGTNTIAYSFNGINWVGLGATPATFTTEGTGILWIPELSLWVATGNGANSVLTSPDGINWSSRSSTGVDNVGRGLDWSSVLNLYCMVGTGSHSIATSSDGILWSGRTGTTIFSTQGNAVIHVAALSIWVALGQGTNTIATSPDGVTWTGRGATIFTTAGLCIDWNGTTFVAGGSGTNTIATSPDGITWTGRGATAITTQVRGVAWSPSLRLWVVNGSGTNAFATSADNGVTWTGRTGTTFFSTQGETIEWSPQLNMFVAGGSGTNTLATSSDGLVWAGTSLLNAIMTVVNGVAWNGQYWIAVGSGTNAVAQSFDGIVWVGRGNPVTSGGNGVAWNGALWVMVGNGSNTQQTVATSTDGITWISRGSAFFDNGWAIVWFAYRSIWIGCSAQNILTSFDGISWTSRRSGVHLSVAVNNTAGLAVVGINSNAVVTSTDGVNWTSRTITNGPSQIRGVAYSPTLNLWVVVGVAGTNTIATSPDGINWTARTGTTIFSTQGNSVTWNGNYFIATGQGTNVIAVSADGINWRGYPTQQAISVITSVGLRLPLMVAGGQGTNTICTSDDNGLSWRPRFATGTNISCIAWNGYIWVAGSGSIAAIYTSPDGITWTSRTNPFTTFVRALTWADQLKLWVAGGSGTNTIATSPDGITWTARVPTTGGIFTTCFAIEWNGSRFVALGTVGTLSSTSAVSNNGLNWSPTSSTITGGTNFMSLAWNGNVWVAVTDGATNIWSSPDGVIWTTRSNFGAGNGRVVRWNGSVFVAFGSSTEYRISRDGFTWTTGTGTIPFAGTNTVTGAVWNSAYGHWVITGIDSGTNLISIATTRDLVTFTPRMMSPNVTSVNSFAWSQQLGLWAAVAPAPAANILTSPDGTTWTTRQTNVFTSGFAVAWNGSLFVAGGGTSVQFYTSTDGITWTSRTNGGIGTLNQVNGIVWASSLSIWVAVGQNFGLSGLIASSTDGINWTIRNNGAIFTTTALGVAWNGSLFVAVGQGTNCFATSTDGITWSARGATGITTAARGVVWATAPGVTSLWVAVGNGTNSIATSPDGITWTGRTTTTIFSTQGNQVANNGFATVATGTGTNSYAWSYDNGQTWTGGGTTSFGAVGQGIAWNSNTGQWLGGASNAPFFLSSPDGINWISRQNFTTSATCVAMENRPEKTFVINNAHWTGRTSQQTFRILS